MATFVLTDAFVSIASQDLSDHVQQAAIDEGTETQDDTAMGDSNRSAAGGLGTAALEVTLLQDYAANSVDDTLNALVGTQVALEVRPTSASVSATNPKWTGTFLCTAYNPVSGSVGDQAVASASFVSDGDGFARATA